MAITPQTNLFILKNPLLIDNKNQITFANKTAQFNYFHSLPFLEVDNISYQRKDNIIRFPAHIDQILEYNYCMYQNENYGDKWFYAFITNMVYISDTRTDIYISTDVFQTWQFNIQFQESFIEREMINVSEDIPGANLVPEGLETGEFTEQGEITVNELQPIYIIAFLGDKLGTLDVPQNGYKYNGIYSSITFIATNRLAGNLELINNQGDGDKIFTVFTVPQIALLDILPSDLSQPWSEILSYDFMESIFTLVINSVPESLNGYTPRNQKLRTYPYTFFGFNPMNGGQKVFRYENFNGNPSFEIISEINPNPNVCFIPKNYKNISNNISETVNLSGYPTISYKNEYFNTWLAQNQEIIQLQMNQEQFNYQIGQIETTGNGITNLLSQALGKDVGSLSTGMNLGLQLAKNDINHEYYIKNQMAQIEKQKLLPDKGTLSASNATLIGYNYFGNNIFAMYTIKSQFAERIDKFFDCYGYLTNKIKTPNLNNRPNWNYIKTIGVNIKGNIPQNDLQTIKNIFDNGVTLWHNPNTFLDYSQNNR